MKKILFGMTLMAVCLFIISCQKKYDCKCATGAIEVQGTTYNFDTTLVIESASRTVAATQCSSYQEAPDVLLPSGAPTSLVNIECSLQ